MAGLEYFLSYLQRDFLISRLSLFKTCRLFILLLRKSSIKWDIVNNSWLVVDNIADNEHVNFHLDEFKKGKENNILY